MPPHRAHATRELTEHTSGTVKKLSLRTSRRPIEAGLATPSVSLYATVSLYANRVPRHPRPAAPVRPAPRPCVTLECSRLSASGVDAGAGGRRASVALGIRARPRQPRQCHLVVVLPT